MQVPFDFCTRDMEVEIPGKAGEEGAVLAEWLVVAQGRGGKGEKCRELT